MQSNNTRRYPRTLAEAFPKQYANPIEGPERQPANFGAFFVAMVVVVLVMWLV